MATTVTVKGQITLPKAVREMTGIRPGDKVEVRAIANGVLIQKPNADDEYLAGLYALAKRKVIRGITTDELMEISRGEVSPAKGKTR